MDKKMKSMKPMQDKRKKQVMQMMKEREMMRNDPIKKGK